MAFWNAPIDVDGHEKMACDATLRMHKVMADLNAEREKEAKAENKKYLELKDWYRTKYWWMCCWKYGF